jgi:disulfide bond formation protein DsbB
MSPAVRIQPVWRSDWLFAVLLLAVLLRGIVPAGWMPALGPEGPQLVICTAERAVAAPADWDAAAGHEVPAQSGDHEPCAFAGLGVSMLPMAIGISVGYALVAIVSAPPTGPPAPTRGLGHHFLPPAQAPPVQD